MMQNRSFRAISLLALASLLLCSLLLAPSALKAQRSEDGVIRLSGVDDELLVGQIDHPVDLFNSPEVAWQGGTDTTVLSTPMTLPFDALPALEGSRALLLSDPSYQPWTGLQALYTFSEEDMPNQTASGWFTLSLALPSGVTGELSLTIRSSIIDAEQSVHRLSYEKTVSLTEGGWQTYLFDISAFLGRTGIREIEITVKPDTPHATLAQAAIDAVGFSSVRDPAAALRFLSDSYVGNGCTLSYGERMTVSAGSSSATFTAESLPTLTLGNQSAICVALLNHAGFRRLTCTYEDADTGALRYATKSLTTATQSIQYCYFPIDANEIESVSFLLEGGSGGEVSILSISAVSYAVWSGREYGTLTGCVIDTAKTRLTVSGTLAEGVDTEFEGASLALYALPLYQTVSDLIGATMTPLAKIPLTESFALSTPVSQSALTSGYCVMIERGSERLPLTHPIHLQNPEIFASASSPLPDADSKKGSADLTGTTVFDGLSYTAIPLRLESLLTLDRTAHAYETDGTVYYYNEEALSALDAQIALCKDRGIRAMLVLTASPSQDAALNRILLHPDSSPDAPFCAFNTASGDGIRYLRAAIAMLCDRYLPEEGDVGGLVGFTVGEAVNDTATHYNLGEATLHSFVRHYAAALRLVSNTAHAISPHFEVYAAFDSRFSAPSGRRPASRFGTRPTLDLLNDIITAEGDFPWQVAYNPYPAAGHYAFDDTDPDLTVEAEHVTLSNLEVLTSYISRSEFYIGRSYRSILLLDSISVPPSRETDEATRIRQSADFVYGYYKITTRNFSLVKALIVNREVDYNDTLCYIDTEHTSAVTSYALELLGIEDWSTRITAFEPTAAVTRRLSINNLTHMTPSSILGELTLWSFAPSTPLKGWAAGTGITSLQGGVSIGTDYYLSALTHPAEYGAYRELYLRPATPYDFTSTPYLRFTCNVSGLPESVQALDVTVAIFSGSSCLRADGTVAGGELTTLVVDMTDFPQRKEVREIRILLKGQMDADIGSPTLLIGAVQGLSEQYSDGDLKDVFEKDQNPTKPRAPAYTPDPKALTFFALLLVGAGILELIHVLLRRKRDGEQTR